MRNRMNNISTSQLIYTHKHISIANSTMFFVPSPLYNNVKSSRNEYKIIVITCFCYVITLFYNITLAYR